MTEDKNTRSEGPSEEDVRDVESDRCPKCGAVITSDEAETCPKCGADLVPPAGVKVGRIIAILVLLLLLAGIVLVIWKM